ncbi:MAG: DUF4397 domain-containing protein [Ktedonobacteraceae bacterium]|nr:DUF4397 domain-containing protein [Ktedonobacteraceae bacterium]
MKFKFTALLWVRRAVLATGVLAVLVFFGVQPLRASARSEGNAFIRIVHASPDVGIVDVFVDGNRLLSSFQFATVTGYVPLPAGSHRIQVALIGTGVNAAVMERTIDTSLDGAYTVAALGTKATGFSINVFTDNNLISGHGTKVRLYHLSPGTGSVRVDVGAKAIISGLAYQQVSDYVAIPAGTYTFQVTVVPQDTTVPFSATLQPWTVTSVFAIGLFNGHPKLELVSAQVAGIPHMPATGSDPRPQPAASYPLAPWLVGLLVALAISAAIALQRLTFVSRRAALLPGK